MTLTARDLADLLRSDGARVLAEHECCVLADRPILGMPGHLRSTVFHRPDASHGWTGAQFHRWQVEATPVTFASERIVVSHLLHSYEEAEMWYGGACSVPVSRREVAAIVGEVA